MINRLIGAQIGACKIDQFFFENHLVSIAGKPYSFAPQEPK